jgi:hypothetical protein
MQISIVTKLPNYNGPKLSVPGSIAQGDTIDNNDNLPDAGGGVVARITTPPVSQVIARLRSDVTKL